MPNTQKIEEWENKKDLLERCITRVYPKGTVDMLLNEVISQAQSATRKEILDGIDVSYKSIKDAHLLNIIKFVKRRAKELDGEVIDGGGFDAEDIWYEIGDEEDLLEHFDYRGLLEEAKRRKLL